MTATEVLDAVSAAGGRVWLVGDKVRARLPRNLGPLVPTIREYKPQIIEILSARPPMPCGVRLIRYEPMTAPVQLSQCETVVDTGRFIQSTLQQVDARLHGKNWLAGNWPLSGLVERLACVGCVVELENSKVMLQ